MMQKLLNGLAYEPHFREELHANGLPLFDLVAAADLPALSLSNGPDLTALPETDRLPRLRRKFEELHDLSACGHALG